MEYIHTKVVQGTWFIYMQLITKNFIKDIPICNNFVIQVSGQISIISNLRHFLEYMPLICTPMNIYSVV